MNEYLSGGIVTIAAILIIVLRTRNQEELIHLHGMVLVVVGASIIAGILGVCIKFLLMLYYFSVTDTFALAFVVPFAGIAIVMTWRDFGPWSAIAAGVAGGIIGYHLAYYLPSSNAEPLLLSSIALFLGLLIGLSIKRYATKTPVT